MATGATVGFHAAYTIDVNDTPTPNSVANAMIGAYANQLGLPMSAVIYLTQPQPEEMRWLTIEDAIEVGIDVDLFETSKTKGLPR